MKTGIAVVLTTVLLIGCGGGKAGGGGGSSDNGVIDATGDPGGGGGSGTAPEFLSFYLPSGTVNRPYSTTLTAMGGLPPYTFSIFQYSLPPGLTLTGATGIISGSPAVAGTYTFYLTLTDSTGAFDIKQFGIMIGSDFLAMGAGWHAVASGTNASLFGVDFTDANTGWVVGLAGTIRRTTNGGVQFEDKYGHPGHMSWGVTNLPTDPTGNVTSTSAGLAIYHFTKVDALSANVAWIGTKGGTTVEGFINDLGQVMSHVLRTTNGAATWDRIITTNGQYAAGIHAFSSTEAKLATRDEYATDSTFISIAASSDQWHVAIPSATLQDVAFITTSTGLLAGKGIWRTTNGGASWNLVSGSATTYRAVSWIDASTVVIVGDGGKILRSTNAGQSWTVVALASTDLYDVSFSGQTGWAVGLGGIIVRTANGGQTWSYESSGTSQHLYGVSAVNATTAWTVGANGVCLKRQ